MGGRVGLLALAAAAFVAVAWGKRGSSSSFAYSLETYPNPTGEGSRCGPHDRVCDPQHVLSTAASERIQDTIFALERENELAHACGNAEGAGYQVAVALVKKMSIPWSSSKEGYAETFARGLHDRWGVGHAACDDGVVLFLAIEDRYMFISRGKGAENLLTDDYADAIIDRMKPLLRKALYDEAVTQGVLDIQETLHPVKRGRGDVAARVKTLAHEKDRAWPPWVPILGFALIFALFLWLNYREDARFRQRRGAWQAARNRLSQLEQARAAQAAALAAAGAAGGGGGPDGGAGGAAPPPVAPEEQHDPTPTQYPPVAPTTPGAAAAGATPTAPRYAGMGTGNPDADPVDDTQPLLGSPASASGEDGQLRRRVVGSSASAAQRTSGSGGGSSTRAASGGPRGSGGASSAGPAVPPLAARMPCCPICLDDFVDAPTTGSATTAGAATQAGPSTDAGAAGDPEEGANPAQIVVLPCQHRFHMGCIDGWFGGQARNTCPVCRTPAFRQDGSVLTAEEVRAVQAGGAAAAAAAAPPPPPPAAGGGAGGYDSGYGATGGAGTGGAGSAGSADSSSSYGGRQSDWMDYALWWRRPRSHWRSRWWRPYYYGWGTRSPIVDTAALASLDAESRDLAFLLQSLHRRYPDAVSQETLTRWVANPATMATAPLVNDPSIAAAEPKAPTHHRSSGGSSRSSGSFGGGRSSGGRGGGW